MVGMPATSEAAASSMTSTTTFAAAAGADPSSGHERSRAPSVQAVAHSFVIISLADRHREGAAGGRAGVAPHAPAYAVRSPGREPLTRPLLVDAHFSPRLSEVIGQEDQVQADQANGDARV